jgi:parvulin-like peptidyl-prolyl isomerase
VSRSTTPFFLPERIEVSQILLPTEAKAVEVWDKAKLTSAEGFRDLAITESIGPEASQGGVMGIFQKASFPRNGKPSFFIA